MSRLFPGISGLSRLSSVTQRSNEVLFDVVENLLDVAEAGASQRWVNATLNEHKDRFTAELLRERDEFVGRNQEIILQILHPERALAAASG